MPVIVSGTGPRAVVTTASYEARRFGVGSAMPTSRARRLCPQAVLVPPDFEAYRATSQEVWTTVRDHVERVEQVGIDEAYVDLTGVGKPLRCCARSSPRSRRAPACSSRSASGPTASSRSAAATSASPAGFVAMGREEACARFAAAPPSRLPGDRPEDGGAAGRAWASRRSADLQRADPEVLSARFGGRTGPVARAPRAVPRRLGGRARARGEVAVERDDVRPRRRGRGRAGGRRPAAGRRGRRRPAPPRAPRADDRDQGAARRLDDGDARADDRRLHRRRRELVAEVALELLRAYAPPRPVRLLGVRIAGFDDAEPEARAGAQGQAAPAGQLALPL